MIYKPLGNTGFNVSALSLGTLTMGPLQADYSVSMGSNLIKSALKLGINLFDTAEIYKTYGHIKAGKLPTDGSSPAFIISKSYAYDYASMKQSVIKALKETGRKFIDIFMLHQQESALTLKGHEGALQYLIEAKKRGLIRAIGISTHHISAVKASLDYKDIEVIFAILNSKGLGIMDGGRTEMESALNDAYKQGKGILIMKALGGGHFFRDVKNAFEYINSLPFVSSCVVGAGSTEEIQMNSMLIEGKNVPIELEEKITGKERHLNIETDSCQGCGQCVLRCPQKAINIIKNKAIVEHAKCILCAYCASACPDFCIEVV